MDLYKLFRKVYTFDDVIEKFASCRWDCYDEFGITDYYFRRFYSLIKEGPANVSFDRNRNIDVLRRWLNDNMDKFILSPNVDKLVNLDMFIRKARHVRRIDLLEDKEVYMVWRSAIKHLYHDWYKEGRV